MTVAKIFTLASGMDRLVLMDKWKRDRTIRAAVEPEVAAVCG